MAPNVQLAEADTATQLQRFIADYVASARTKGVVIGISGGLDSAVVAALAVRALGPERVHGFALPSLNNHAEDLEHAKELAAHLGIELGVHEVQPVVDAALSILGGEAEPAMRGNLTARARMAILYAEAARRGCIVLGTGNKSELLVGYFTKYGDGGTDLLPIGDLYKTQVRLLAAELGVPAGIIERPPTAGLWEGQTDEEELGMTYEVLDQVLLGLEIGLAHARIAEEVGITKAEVGRVDTMRRHSQHKRRMPLVCKLGIRTVGNDMREAVTGAAPEA